MNYKAITFHNSGHTQILGKIATRAQIKKSIYSIFDSLMNALLFCIDFCVCVCVCTCAWEGFLRGFAVNRESEILCQGFFYF